MAYTVVPTAYASSPKWSATWVNKYIQANFAAGVPDIFTTKGDLAVATAADTATRLAVGADGLVLTADSATSTGLRWGHPGLIKVNDAGVQAIANSATKLTELDNEFYDLYSSWSSDRYTCTYPGYYLVTCMFQFDMYTLGNFAVGDGGNFMIYKNGDLYSTIVEGVCQAVGDYIVSTFGADIIYLVPGDYIEFYSGRLGQSINVNPSADDTCHHISITYLPS